MGDHKEPRGTTGDYLQGITGNYSKVGHGTLTAALVFRFHFWRALCRIEFSFDALRTSFYACLRQLVCGRTRAYVTRRELVRDPVITISCLC